MQKKVLIRTAQKVGILFAAAFGGIAAVELASWAGDYLFGHPLAGSIFIVVASILSAVVYFAYKEAKYEVDRENNKLIQELTKHG